MLYVNVLYIVQYKVILIRAKNYVQKTFFDPTSGVILWAVKNSSLNKALNNVLVVLGKKFRNNVKV